SRKLRCSAKNARYAAIPATIEAGNILGTLAELAALDSAATGLKAADRNVGRKPHGFDSGRATPGRNVKPGTLPALERIGHEPTPSPRGPSVSRADQLSGLGPRAPAPHRKPS